MRTFSLLIIFIVSLSISGFSYAQTLSGKDLYDMCKNIEYATSAEKFNLLTQRELTNTFYCLGYMNSFSDGQSQLKHLRVRIVGPTDKDITHITIACMPEDIGTLDVTRVFLNHIEKHKDQFGLGAYDVVRDALIKSYPCEKKKVK